MNKMQEITAIIVDDEQDSRTTLRKYCAKYCPYVNIQAECKNNEEAQIAILKFKPQLVFLDIEMPRGNAFDLLEQIENIEFEIIFITAFSQYAIQAFNLSASHYLLKPLSIEELVDAVHTVRDEIYNKQQINKAEILLQNIAAIHNQNRKLVLPLMEGLEIVRMSDVLYCEADDNFTHFYLTDGRKLMICRNLKFYESSLDPFGFFRIHRSHIINLEYIKRYIKGKGGSVVMENGEEIIVSNSKKSELIQRLRGH
ncbi:MAG: LytTR family DNA-binding domain-containing protein [Saprospiraceae bacterium]|nr:LytTR family DNA-binding domain-containing protein [Saprospiraceae bacterium]